MCARSNLIRCRGVMMGILATRLGTRACVKRDKNRENRGRRTDAERRKRWPRRHERRSGGGGEGLYWRASVSGGLY